MVPEMSTLSFVQSNWTATVLTGAGPGVKTYWSSSTKPVADAPELPLKVPDPHVVPPADTLIVAEKACPAARPAGGTIWNAPPLGPGPSP